MKKTIISEKGQSLVEAVGAIALTAVVVVALGNFAVRSVRDADYAKNQLQASKYAQEGIEAVRAIRDLNNAVATDTNPTWKWNDLWDDTADYYFSLTIPSPLSDASGIILGQVSGGEISDNPAANFDRYVIVEHEEVGKKKVTVRVTWGSDAAQKAEVVEFFSRW